MTNGTIDIRPEFPAQAQAMGIEGAGVFVLHLNRNNGRVISVEVEKSTGHKVLDDAAIAKFNNLRFKPQTVVRVKIPVEFKLPPPDNSTVRGRGYPATALFLNERPFIPSRGRAGGGK